MSIIKTHDIILYGGNDKYKIILRPLSDEHLSYLYRWNSAPEVTYYSEGGYTPDDPITYVHKKYGGMSKNNL